MSGFLLDLTPNDKYVIARWLFDDRPVAKCRMNAADLEDASDDIRAALGKLTDYMLSNPDCSSDVDPKLKNYNKCLADLRRCGADLHSLLVGDENEPLAKMRNALKSKLSVCAEDENITVPIGFAYDGPLDYVSANPSIDDFRYFWLSKFSNIVTWVNTSTLGDEAVAADNFRALYAADENLWRAAFDDAYDRHPTWKGALDRLQKISVGAKHSWDDARLAWQEIRKFDNVLLFFAHSDGVSIDLAGDTRKSAFLKQLFGKPQSTSSTLLIANTCLSLKGNRRKGTSLLSLSARAGFAGMIGTEAEIVSTGSLLCCASLIDDLCFGSYELGQAFDRMRDNPALFPFNLFYSCYGNRTFRLQSPLLAGASG